MIVTQNSTYRLMQTNIERITTKLQDLQVQGATGLKLNAPSDSPSSVSPVLSTRTQITNGNSYLDNMSTASDQMQSTDSYLSGLENILVSAKETTNNAVNGSLSQDDLNTLADKVDQLKQQLLDTANASINGKYIFAGYKQNTKPFVENPTYSSATYDPQDVTTWPVLYQGDSNAINIQITPNEYVQTNITGNSLFMGISDAVAAGGYTNPHQGETITSGPLTLPASGDITITTGTTPPTTTTISGTTDLTDTDNNYAGKVAGLFSQSGTGLFATANAATANLGPLNLTNFNSAEGDTYTLNITSGGSTLSATLDGNPPTGYDLNGLSAALGNTAGATNVTATGGTLANGVSYDISSGSLVLTGPSNGSEIELTQSITDNGTTGASGGITGGNQTVYGTVSITTNTGENVTLDGAGLSSLGITAPETLSGTSSIDLFTLLTQTAADIRSNNLDGMQNDLSNLEIGANQERTLRSRLGIRATRVDDAKTQQQSAQTDFQQLLSHYQDADSIATFAEITKQQTAYQAALSITAQISKISILNYI